MPFNILYNENPITDHLSALTYINDFSKELSLKQVLVDDEALFSALTEMQREFPHVDGLDKASCFKKAGLFLTQFISESPIQSPFDIEKIGNRLHKLPNHANIMTGLQMAIDGLDGASICRENGETIQLNRIQVSKHSYIDLIEALHNISLQNHYKIITVLLEQLAYKSNPKAQYEIADI